MDNVIKLEHPLIQHKTTILRKTETTNKEFRESVEEITMLAEQFNQKPYAINVFPIGSGERKAQIYTSIPVDMPTMKISDNGGYVMRFFNPEEYEKSFVLTINENQTEVVMGKGEVVSVSFKDDKFTVHHNKMPV